MSGNVSIAVVIPTYRRPDDLTRCLGSLADQTRPADQIIVVVREVDDLTIERCRARPHGLAVEIVAVDRPGQVAALNAGLAQVRCDLVAFTDDDCRPHPEWLARISGHFASDERVGAVGGRDIVHEGGAPIIMTARAVGRITPFGRLIGNHHAISAPQDVQFLKGANMAYRRTILRGFDVRLRGVGAQVHNDLKASLEVWSTGCRVIWDPEAIVDHHPAPRADEDRSYRSLTSLRQEHHNETYTLMSIRPRWIAIVAVAYSFIVGTRSAPGMLLLPYALLRTSRRDATLRCFALLIGRLEGLATALGTRRRAMTPAPDSALPACEPATSERSVAVCICTRDRPRELAATLSSIGRSDYPVRRVVVSDDGTDPETKQVCANSRCATIVSYTGGPMQGLSANRNHALDSAAEELVLFLDDDCLLRRDFLTRAITCMRVHEQLHGTGKVVVSGSEENRGNTILAHAQTFLGFQARPYRKFEPLTSIVINAAVFPRTLFEEERFDSQIRYGYEEVDLASRAAKAGYRIVSCPEARNDHRPSGRSRADYDEVLTASRLYITFKRYLLVERRYLQALSFALVAPAHAVLAGMRRRGLTGARDAVAAVALAAGYMRKHLAGP